MKQAFFVLAMFAIVLLTGCANFHDEPGKSVWSEGMWIIPWITGIAGAIWLYQWYKDYAAYKKYPGAKKYKGFGKLFLGSVATVATIVIIIVQVGAR
jgi:hypothetical protein